MDKTFKRSRLPIEKYVEGILSGDRVILSRAITLIESQLVADNQLAEELLNKVLSKTVKKVDLKLKELIYFRNCIVEKLI